MEAKRQPKGLHREAKGSEAVHQGLGLILRRSWRGLEAVLERSWAALGGRLGRRKVAQDVNLSQNGVERIAKGSQAALKMTPESRHRKKNGNAKNIKKKHKENQCFFGI